MGSINRLCFCALAAGCIVLIPMAALANGQALGKTAPPLNVQELLQAPADASAKWSDLRGQVVVLDFWATWCGPCRKSMPHWNELADAFKGKPVRFIAVTDENEAIVALFLKRNPIHSWVGVDGNGPASRERYHIDGIPATVLVNQTGMVVAVTPPVALKSKHIEEVLATGRSSLPPPTEPRARAEEVEPVSGTNAVYEISARRSGPAPRGHPVDCWSWSANRNEITGEYARVEQAILNVFEGSRTLLDCRTPLPTQRYDFMIHLPPGTTRAEREEAAAPMLRSVFGLEVGSMNAEREVYELSAGPTNGPGLEISGPDASGAGSEQPDGLRLSRTTMAELAGFLENRLHKPVIDESGLTNRYEVRLRWKLSERELVVYDTDSRVLNVLDKPDPDQEAKLSAEQRRQLDGVRGKLSAAELQKLPEKERHKIELLRAELAKPEELRFQPEAATVLNAVREQLGLELNLKRRSMPVLVIDQAGATKASQPVE